MTPDQLDALGPSALRQLARQLGLRGAALRDSEALRCGLRAYFQRAAPTSEWDEDEEPEPPSALPPALQTETMAKVLEAQGRQTEAAALRADLQDPEPDGPEPEGVELDLTEARVVIRWRLAPQRFPEADPEEGSPEAGDTYQGEVWLWRDGGGRVTRRFTLPAARGDHDLDRPEAVCQAVAVVGRRIRAGVLAPIARSPIWRRDTATEEPPSS